MEIKSIYLTDGEGITSTSANYLSNLAKETLADAEAQLRSMRFVNKSAELINGDKKNLERGWKDPSFATELIEKIATMHSFIAWMREAINNKESLMNKCDSYTFEQFITEKGIVLSPAPLQKTVLERQIIEEMNVKERQRYLMLESYASAYGKYVHPDGEFSNARKDMYFHINSPIQLDGRGRDMVIFTYEPSTNVEAVEATFLDAQAKHREYEKQLNSMKFKIKEEVNRRNTEYLLLYKEEFQRYKAELVEAQNEWKQEIIKLREKVSKLKIIIPNALRDTYDYLESLVEQDLTDLQV